MSDCGVRVVLLGSGGPRPDPLRNGPAALVQIGDRNLLFDCGRGVTVQLVRAGVALPNVGPVFVTHHHYDHIGDLHDVILSSWITGRRGELRIYGPPDTRRIVDALVTQVYDKDIEWRDRGEPAMGGWQPVAAQDVSPGLVAEGPDWKVFAETVAHGHGLDLPQAFLRRWICYGYRVEARGKVIAISGDTVDCGGLQKLAQGADVLVQCCYMAAAEIDTEHYRRLARHTLACGDTVGKIAARAGVKTVVVTHHRPRPDRAMLERLHAEIAADFGGRIVIGEDLTSIEP